MENLGFRHASQGVILGKLPLIEMPADNPFFERPILNSPYEPPGRHWELDNQGQPTQREIPNRRPAEFITPIPAPRKRKAGQTQLVFDEGKGLSTEKQQYYASLLRRGRCFAIEVEGDSMKGAGIKASDLLIVRQQPVAENGEIIVALLDGEATVKRLVIEGAHVELRPANPRYQPIPVTGENDFRIVGKVVGIWRRPTRGRARFGATSRAG